MIVEYLRTQVADLGSWTINGANTVAFAPGVPARVKRLVLRYTTGNTTGTNGITVQKRPIAGVAANQETLYTFETTITTAAGDIDYAVLGDVTVASSAGVDGSVVYTGDVDNMPVIYPGQDIAFVSDGDGTAGVVNAYVEWIPLAFDEVAIEAAIASIVELTPALA